MVFWIIAGAVFLLGIAPWFVLAAILYSTLLVRTKPDKWGRECSIPDDEEYRRMFDIGVAWNEEHKSRSREVSVTSDGFRLAGEYFDFGGKTAAIIIPGRMESLLYSYYFAEPYRAAGCNVLVIDNRSHGLSEGRFCSLGYKEYRDLIKWSRLLTEELGNERVVLHGICIGSSAALFALTSPDCPPSIAGMVADGMYPTFYESFKNHMIEDHRPLFPLLYLTMLYIRVFSGANVVSDGPIKRISGLKKPILFLHSREDVYSLPKEAERLYGLCGSKDKVLVWFARGAHSRLRINAPEKYDAAIEAFIESKIETEKGER